MTDEMRTDGLTAAPPPAREGPGEDVLLSIRDLDLRFPRPNGSAHALRGVDLDVRRGSVHGLVGESGSGKTVTAKTVLGLVPAPPAEIRSGSVVLDGKEILGLADRELRSIRGRSAAMIFQEPGRYLNPAFRISDQITEMLTLHLGFTKQAAVERAQKLLDLVGLGHGRRVLRSYPHELSGGMKQRAMIAMAVSCSPALLIADEPTTALDVTVQRQILDLLCELNERMSMAILFISHDLSVVHQIADTVSVIYAGTIVESGARDLVFGAPLHPYTHMLLDSIPTPEAKGAPLAAIPGRVPDAEHTPSGCTFHPRCPHAVERCRDLRPARVEYAPGHFAACHRTLELAGGGAD